MIFEMPVEEFDGFSNHAVLMACQFVVRDERRDTDILNANRTIESYAVCTIEIQVHNLMPGLVQVPAPQSRGRLRFEKRSRP